jgi:hypothetical protein
MKIALGDKLYCTETLDNVLGEPLFENGKSYTVLEIRGCDIYMNHNLYANEYGPLNIIFVKKYFYNIKELRKKKLNKMKNNSI